MLCIFVLFSFLAIDTAIGYAKMGVVSKLTISNLLDLLLNKISTVIYIFRLKICNNFFSYRKGSQKNSIKFLSQNLKISQVILLSNRSMNWVPLF